MVTKRRTQWRLSCSCSGRPCWSWACSRPRDTDWPGACLSCRPLSCCLSPYLSRCFRRSASEGKAWDGRTDIALAPVPRSGGVGGSELADRGAASLRTRRDRCRHSGDRRCGICGNRNPALSRSTSGLSVPVAGIDAAVLSFRGIGRHLVATLRRKTPLFSRSAQSICASPAWSETSTDCCKHQGAELRMSRWSALSVYRWIRSRCSVRRRLEFVLSDAPGPGRSGGGIRAGDQSFRAPRQHVCGHSLRRAVWRRIRTGAGTTSVGVESRPEGAGLGELIGAEPLYQRTRPKRTPARGLALSILQLRKIPGAANCPPRAKERITGSSVRSNRLPSRDGYRHRRHRGGWCG